MVELLAGYPFDQLPVTWSYKAKIDTAWQNARDSQLEGYHLKYLHKRTSPGVMSYKEDPDRHSLDYKLLGRHSIGSYFGVRQEAIAAAGRPPGHPLQPNTGIDCERSVGCQYLAHRGEPDPQ